MSFQLLKNYLSRSQIRDYLGYTLENGVDAIVEARDGVHSDEPVEVRFGSTINSIKMFHVERYLGSPLKVLGYALSENDSKPEMPEGSKVVGIIYMSKSKDYVGGPDSFGETSHQGDIGDTLWLSSDSWDSVSLSESTDGINYRFFTFWGDK